MRKVSEIVRSQAAYEFSKKRKQVIHNTIKKFSEKTGKRFEDVLRSYMGNEII